VTPGSHTATIWNSPQERGLEPALAEATAEDSLKGLVYLYYICRLEYVEVNNYTIVKAIRIVKIHVPVYKFSSFPRVTEAGFSNMCFPVGVDLAPRGELCPLGETFMDPSSAHCCLCRRMEGQTEGLHPPPGVNVS
jgi:hypothetical protein